MGRSVKTILTHLHFAKLPKNAETFPVSGDRTRGRMG